MFCLLSLQGISPWKKANFSLWDEKNFKGQILAIILMKNEMLLKLLIKSIVS